jgi:hypothetical protein
VLGTKEAPQSSLLGVRCSDCASDAEYVWLDASVPRIVPLCGQHYRELAQAEGELNLDAWPIDDPAWVEGLNEYLRFLSERILRLKEALGVPNPRPPRRKLRRNARRRPAPPIPSEPLLRPKEAARVFGVAPCTLYSWQRKGVIGAVRLPSGKLRYPLSEVEKLRARLGLP